MTTQEPASAKKPVTKKTISPLDKVRAARAKSASTQGTTSGGTIPQGARPPHVKPLEPRPEAVPAPAKEVQPKAETKMTKTTTTRKVSEQIIPAAPEAPAPAAPAVAPVIPPPLPPASPTPAELQKKADEAKALEDAHQVETGTKKKMRCAISNVRWFPIMKWVLVVLLACLPVFLGANWWIDRKRAAEFAKSIRVPVTLPEVPKESVSIVKDDVWSGIKEQFRNRSSSTPTSAVTSPAPVHNTGTLIIGDGNTIHPGCCPSVQAVTSTPPPALPKAWWDSIVPDYREEILQSCPSPNEVSSQNTKQKLLLPGEGGIVYLIPTGGWRTVPHLVNSIDRSRIKYVVDIGEINKPQWVDPKATSETAISFWIKNTGTEPIPLWFQLTAPK